MNTRKKIIIVLAAVLCLAGVASAGSWNKVPENYWPYPPPEARYQLVGAFRGEHDFDGPSRPFLSRVFRFLVGSTDYWHLQTPWGLDNNGSTLFIADSQAKTVWAVDLQQGVFRPAIKGAEYLDCPMDVAIDKIGRIFVSDVGTGSVKVFDSKGKFIEEIGRQGSEVSGFIRPLGMSIDLLQNRLYIADAGAHRIWVIDTDNFKLVQFFGRRGTGNGEFNFPTDVAVSGNRVYVVDSLNFRVQVFTRAGWFESKFGTLGDAYGDMPRPKGIAVDSSGIIYLTDGVLDTIQLFNREGRFLMFMGKRGSNPGSLLLPNGITVMKDGSIAVCDTGNRRVQIFSPLQGGAD